MIRDSRMSLIPEIEKSLKKDNSTQFLEVVGDILGAVFLTVAEGTKPNDLEDIEISKNVNFCNTREFQKVVNSSDWNNSQALQRYACKISRTSEKLHDSSDVINVEKWRSSVNKLRKFSNLERFSDIYRNILNWQNETNANVPDNTDVSFLKKSAMINEANIDDFIGSVECILQGYQGKLLLYHVNNSKWIVRNFFSIFLP
ncbi:ATP-binding cassette sub-family A member 1 [Trichonephila clavipes]|nr:ATP-binding cassette sub-family A member 1 [Trichonephila clavipes]